MHNQKIKQILKVTIHSILNWFFHLLQKIDNANFISCNKKHFLLLMSAAHYKAFDFLTSVPYYLNVLLTRTNQIRYIRLVQLELILFHCKVQYSYNGTESIVVNNQLPFYSEAGLQCSEKIHFPQGRIIQYSLIFDKLIKRLRRLENKQDPTLQSTTRLQFFVPCLFKINFRKLDLIE